MDPLNSIHFPNVVIVQCNFAHTKYALHSSTMWTDKSGSHVQSSFESHHLKVQLARLQNEMHSRQTPPKVEERVLFLDSMLERSSGDFIMALFCGCSNTKSRGDCFSIESRSMWEISSFSSAIFKFRYDSLYIYIYIFTNGITTDT